MPAPGWLRRWRGANRAGDQGDAAVRAAVNGQPLNQILELGAWSLLAAANADRAGVWLTRDRQGGSGRGCVVERAKRSVPEEWNRLDVSTQFLRGALESRVPLHLNFTPGEETLQLGPHMGLHTAIWLPLRSGDAALGLAMVGHARPAGRLDMKALQTRADEIALAVQHHRDTRRRELAAEELRVQVSLFRAIRAGVSADSILPQIASAARRYLQAGFIALARGSEPPVAGEGWEGRDEWLALGQQETLARLWQKVFNEGRESEIPGETIPASERVRSDAPNRVLRRVVAMPIEVHGRPKGVLMAGLSHSEDSGDELAKLEFYRQLATSALEGDAARQEEISSSENQRKIIEGSRECLILIDERGKIQEASRAAALRLFLPWNRLDEIQLEDLFSPIVRGKVEEWRNQLRSRASAVAADRDDFPVGLEAALARGGVIRARLRSELKGRPGENSRWLIQFEEPGVGRSLRETERLEAEIAGLLDSIESGVLLLDEEGRVRMASDRLADILGIEARRLMEFGSIDSLIERVSHQFQRPAETASRWREHALRGEEAGWDEFELVRPSRKIVERFGRPLHRADGSRLGWLEVYRDITGQRLIQSKLLQTEKMAALGQLVSGIAHELNNPLTSIQGYAQLLLGRRTVLDRTSDAQHISQEADRAARIVKNLLLFARETKPERRAVNLNELIERTLSLRSYELKIENIEVELDLDPGLPQTLADAAQLQQVVLNLIVNAEQAIVMSRGEDAGNGRILLRTTHLPGDRIALEVSDNGPGIPPEIVSRIFDPFFTTKPAGVGTGLGLSIVYGIIQEHGGEVTAESLRGRGARLVVELPALTVPVFNIGSEGAALERRAATVMPLPHSTRAASRKDILIVEDEPTVAQLIADVMTEEGHRVDTLLDSRQALRQLEEKAYALLICDLKMPHLDGPGLYRDLKSRKTQMPRLLFVTGDTLAPRTLEFLQSSGVPYLAKPFLVEELKEAVRNALAEALSDEVAAGTERSRAAARET